MCPPKKNIKCPNPQGPSYKGGFPNLFDNHIIRTKGALRRPMTYYDQPIPSHPVCQSLQMKKAGLSWTKVELRWSNTQRQKDRGTVRWKRVWLKNRKTKNEGNQWGQKDHFHYQLSFKQALQQIFAPTAWNDIQLTNEQMIWFER